MTTSYSSSVDFTNSISDSGTHAGYYIFNMRMAIAGQQIQVSATCKLDPVTRRRMLSETAKMAIKKELFTRII